MESKLKRSSLKLPLVEVIFEIRFPAELSIECKKDEYYEKIRNNYPNIYVPTITSPEPYPLKTYEFKNNEETEMLRFSINRFSVHSYIYKSFDWFKERASKYPKLFCKMFKINVLRRTGLRYINHINLLPSPDEILPIDQVLNVNIKLPEAIPTNLKDINLQFVTKFDQGNLKVLIQHQRITREVYEERIVLDLDYFLTKDLHAEKIDEYLNLSHANTKKVFEALITKFYKEKFEQGG